MPQKFGHQMLKRRQLQNMQIYFRESATKLLNSLETFSREADDKYPDNWNGKNVSKYGFQLCQGLKAFAESNYEEAFRDYS